MKAMLAVVCVAAALIGVVIFEESRISALEKEVAALKKEPVKVSGAQGSRAAGGTALAAGGPDAKSGRVKEAGGGKVVDDPRPGRKSADEHLGETIRKMMENPVGQAMFRQEHKAKASLVYGQLLDSYDFTKEERDYFLDLVAADVGEDDTVGMKMFTAENDEERVKILDQMEEDRKKRREAMKDFLNSDEDFDRYDRYHARADEYEQMPTIRTAMSEAGAPMNEDLEGRLVEAMFEARTETGVTDRWDGRAGMEQFGEPGTSDRFIEDWDEIQESLGGKVDGILTEPQQEALQEQQGQVRDLALLGIRMVEGMIQAGQGGE